MAAHSPMRAWLDPVTQGAWEKYGRNMGKMWECYGRDVRELWSGQANSRSRGAYASASARREPAGTFIATPRKGLGATLNSSGVHLRANQQHVDV